MIGLALAMLLQAGAQAAPAPAFVPIEFYDAKKQELVWHGWKSRKVLPPDSPELPQVVEQATVDILSNFPPG